MSFAKFMINDLWYSVDLTTLPADITLNTFIRQHAQLPATKFMCLEGGCGACVVTIKGKHPVTGNIRTWAANSCLTLLNSCVEWEITTCEGIGNKLKGYHPIQRRLAKLNGTQCGFCTPGFIMNMYSLLESRDNKVTMEEIENSFGGNICRCTGYRSILDAMKGFACDITMDILEECGDIEELSIKSCPKSGLLCSGGCKNLLKVLSYNDGSQWYWPKTIDDLFAILLSINSDEEYTLVAGNTAHGVYRRSETIKHFIDINGIADLKKYNLCNKKLKLGANLTLTEAMDIFKEASSQPGYAYCQQLWRHFDQIANVPVRNEHWPVTFQLKNSDVFLTFEALNVQLIVATEASEWKTVSLLEYMNSKARKMVIVAFELPAIPKDKSIFKLYKIMPRAQNAHAFVNAAFLLNLATGIVSNARLCFGGIRPDFIHATEVEQLLRYQCFYDKAVVSQIFSELPKILKPDEVLPDASPAYRCKLACGLMLKFLLDSAPVDMVRPEYRSGGLILKRNLSSGVQIFDTHTKNYPVTQPVQKLDGFAMIENIMEHIAFKTGVDPADVRKINTQPGNKMNELLPHFLISREYERRRQEIDDFNSKHRWMKRGIGLSIMEFKIDYVGPFPATVSVYNSDGSVVISHGGTEMGQGLNTKVAQVAAFHLGIPLELVKIEASDTINGANAFSTAASVTSEGICYAVRKACNVLNERLKPIRASLKENAPWLEVIQAARSKPIHLIASEEFKVGDMNTYSIYGLALSEVTVDILTGNLIINRVDVLEDCGQSLSPYIDIGQVEGAFMMGIGYWLTERLVYDRETGKLLTNRTWTYKPPGAKDIPIDFRVELLQGSTNAGGFMRSKAAGEPPGCLAVSVIFAIQHALQSARRDAGVLKEWVRLGAPSTPETIVLNAGHDVSSFTLK